MKPRLRAGLCLGGVVALGAVSFLSLTGNPSLPVGPQFNDKVNHFLAYAVLAFFFSGAQKRPVAYVITGAALVLYGLGMEAGQAIMSEGRKASALDALANTAGVAFGLIASRTLRAFVFPVPSDPEAIRRP